MPDQELIERAKAFNASYSSHLKIPAEAIAAFAQSEIARARIEAMEECAVWHDNRARDTPDAFEMEFHRVSAAAIRAASKAQP